MDINTINGWLEITTPCHVIDNDYFAHQAPGLGTWSVTHIDSGFAVVCGHRRMRDAVNSFKKISKDDIQEAIGRIRK